MRIPAVTFDYEFTKEFENVIASVNQPFEEMAKEAFNMVVEISRGRLKIPAVKILQPEIIRPGMAQEIKHAV